MSKTVKIEVFEFTELSGKAKQDARDCLSPDGAWWTFVYDDARDVGIEIIEFDLHGYIKIKIPDLFTTCRLIEANHGKECDSYIAALKFLKEEAEDDLFTSISIERFYLKMLQDEYDHITSDEYYIELCESNNYWFYKNGKLFYEHKP